MRAILPLCPFAQLCESLLANRLKRHIDLLLPATRGVHIGARRGTQPVEIPCALHVACEKSQDYGMPSAFGQIDCLQHYDRLDVEVILNWLRQRGVPEDVLAVTAVFQMFSNVSLHIAGRTIQIGSRGIGGLTGKRVAGQLGRVLVESSVLRVHSKLAHMGMPIFMTTAAAEPHKPEDVVMQWEPFCQTTFATYVDNCVYHR